MIRFTKVEVFLDQGIIREHEVREVSREVPKIKNQINRFPPPPIYKTIIPL
jgi:hypothetical protein